MDELTRVSNATLEAMPEAVRRPAYDRAALTPGIVHIGVGNFHRAHQAMYLDRLFGLGEDHDWALVGAGVRAADVAVRDDLAAQDWLTTVVELNPGGLTAHVCGSMIDYVEPGAAALIAALSAPEIRIVSLTVTEGGYFIDPATGGFALDHPAIVADIANPDAPETAFGIIVAALAARRAAGVPAFTVMSCDNLPHNGVVTRNAVVVLATAISEELGEWIVRNASFPNGMVDCITPATGPRERALVAENFGIRDARPVVCEPFRQWVLEDDFCAGRPALEKVGVEFVADVAPHELMKLRILNGGHATIAYPAALLGIEMVHDAMAEPRVAGFLGALERREIIPMVPPIPGVDFDAYFATVVERFSNPAIGDTIARLCQDGSNRQPKFILPVISARLTQGLPIAGLALEVALWCRYCAGTDENGGDIPLDDPMAATLRERALRAKDDPGAFLSLDAVFGSLGGNADFRAAFATALRALWQQGVARTLADYAREPVA